MCVRSGSSEIREHEEKRKRGNEEGREEWKRLRGSRSTIGSGRSELVR